MCGRFLLDQDFDTLYKNYRLFETEPRVLVHGDLRPTDQAPVIVHENGHNQLRMMKWGLSGYEKHQVLINARSETLLAKSRFSRLMNGQRCIVPATAFYEWEKVGSQKMMHTFANANPLSFAALYETTPSGSAFTIITMAAKGDIVKIHDRMPVNLNNESLDLWLRPEISAVAAYEKLLEQEPQYFLNDLTTQLSFF